MVVDIVVVVVVVEWRTESWPIRVGATKRCGRYPPTSRSDDWDSRWGPVEWSRRSLGFQSYDGAVTKAIVPVVPNGVVVVVVIAVVQWDTTDVAKPHPQFVTTEHWHRRYPEWK